MAGRGYTKDGKVSFRDSSGNYVWVPEKEVQNAVNEGLQAESPKEYHQRGLAEEADTFAGKAETFGKGLLSSATLGASDWVEHQGPGATFENTQRRLAQKEENPWSDIGGQVAGMLTPGGVVSGAGKLGIKVGQKALAKASANIASKTAAKNAAGIAGASLLEGAAAGAGSAIGEQGFTGDFDMTQVAKRAATDMVISGVMTAGIMGVGKGFKKAYGAAKNKLHKQTGVDPNVQDELINQHIKIKEELDQFDTIKNDQGQPIRKEIEMNQYNMEAAAKDIRSTKEKIAKLKKQQSDLGKRYDRDVRQAQKDWDTIRAQDEATETTLRKEAEKEFRATEKANKAKAKQDASHAKESAQAKAQREADEKLVGDFEAKDKFSQAEKKYKAAKKKYDKLDDEWDDLGDLTADQIDNELGRAEYVKVQAARKAADAEATRFKKIMDKLEPKKAPSKKQIAVDEAKARLDKIEQERLGKFGMSREQVASRIEDPQWLANVIENNKPLSARRIAAEAQLEKMGIRLQDIAEGTARKVDDVAKAKTIPPGEGLGSHGLGFDDIEINAKPVPPTPRVHETAPDFGMPGMKQDWTGTVDPATFKGHFKKGSGDLERLMDKQHINSQGRKLADEQMNETFFQPTTTAEERLYIAKRDDYGLKMKMIQGDIADLNRQVEAGHVALEIAEKRAGKVAARYGVDEQQLARMAAAPDQIKKLEAIIHDNRKALWQSLGGAFKMGGLNGNIGWGLGGGFLSGEGFSIKGALLGLVARKSLSLLGSEGAMNVAHKVYKGAQKAGKVASSKASKVTGKAGKHTAANDISSKFRTPRFGAMTMFNKQQQDEFARSYDMNNPEAMGKAAYEGVLMAGVEQDMAEEIQTYYVDKAHFLQKAAKQAAPISFSKLYHAANEPQGITSRLRKKKASREDITVLRELFTDTYHRLVAEAQNLQRKPEILTAKQRRQIEIILAPEEPSKINQAVTKQANKEQQQEQKPPGGQATSPAVPSSTPMQRIAKGQM